MFFSQKLKKPYLNLINFKNSNDSKKLDNNQQDLSPTIAELNKKLLTAIKHFDLEKVKILLDKGANPNMSDDDQVPLILLIMNMHKDSQSAKLLKLLINHSKYKVNLDQQDNLGRTALMYLVSSSVKTKDQIEALIQAGADANIRNNEHKTVMDIAKKLGRSGTYNILKTCSNAYKVTNLLDREAYGVGSRLAKIKYRDEFLGQTFFDKIIDKKNTNYLKRLSDDVIQNIGLYLYSRSRVTLDFMEGFLRKKQKYQESYTKKMLQT